MFSKIEFVKVVGTQNLAGLRLENSKMFHIPERFNIKKTQAPMLQKVFKKS